MKTEITREMLWDIGVQFGHQVKRWNPKMKPFIYRKKNKIHIIDLQQTIERLEMLKPFMQQLAENKGKILFVGTKKSAKSAVKEAAERSENFYVCERWLGGLLTNLKTIHLSIKKLWEIEKKEQSGYYESYSKKEFNTILKQKNRLETFLGGIKNMKSLPSALFVVDPKTEIIAVKEARKLNIPIIGICDTNSDPDLVDYIIPANDDSYRGVSFLANHIADLYAKANGMKIPPSKVIEKRKPWFERNENFKRKEYLNKNNLYQNQRSGYNNELKQENSDLDKKIDKNAKESTGDKK